MNKFEPFVRDILKYPYQRGLVRNFVTGAGIAYGVEQKNPWFGCVAVAAPMPAAGYLLWTHRAAIKTEISKMNDAEMTQLIEGLDKLAALNAAKTADKPK